MDIDYLRQCFPFEQPRPGQFEAVTKIIESYYNNKKIFILESPTGVGKSGIGYCVGKYLVNKHFPKNDSVTIISESDEKKKKHPNCIINTNTKSLQQQYIKTFENKQLESIWSSDNFECKDEIGSASDVHYGKTGCKKRNCEAFKKCPYIIQRNKFKDSTIGVCNYHYFLNSQDTKPPILILDEAHNIEDLLCSCSELRSSDYVLFKLLNKLNQHDKKYDYISSVQLLTDLLNNPKKDKLAAIKYFQDTIQLLIPARNELQKLINIHQEKLKLAITNQQKIDLTKEIGSLQYHSNFIDTFQNKYTDLSVSDTDWVFSDANKDEKTFILKPLDVKEFFFRITERSQFIIMMSATICGEKQFAENIGIDSFDYHYTDMIIPAKNRPVYSLSLGHINYQNKNEVLPKFIKYMDAQINRLTDNWEKPYSGIIHAISKDNAKFIRDNSQLSDKMIVPTKYDLLKLDDLFKDGNKILVSYNMIEGIDLKDDMSRFQFFPKLPYQTLADEWIKRKMQLSQKWYNRECIIKIIQGCGRSIRSETDWALTFILDSNFDRLFLNNKELFPKWFKEAIIFRGKK